MQSMTGFAAAAGGIAGRRWRWEVKSVNGRGLDLRFRLAEGFEAFEPAFRVAAGKRLSRGNVTFVMRGEDGEGSAALILDREALNSAIEATGAAEAAAAAAGLALAPSSAAQILAFRGVMDIGAGAVADDGELSKAAGDSFGELLDALAGARADEGARLATTLGAQVDEIETLSLRAAEAYATQQAGAPARLAEKMKVLTDAAPEVEPDRLAQELVLLAVKADVREELDRLAAHVAAARDLIVAKGPVGRKLDFLMQEFNREVNTLCSKSGAAALTAIGLELKVVVDQMREQVQNVE